MMKISKIYFNFEKHIIIDLKSNVDKTNHAIFVNLMFFIPMNNIPKEIMDSPCKFSSNYNETLYIFIDCLAENKISSNYFISKFEKFFETFTIYFSGNEYKLGDIPHESKTFYFDSKENSKLGEFLLNFHVTIEISKNIYHKNDNSVLKVFDTNFNIGFNSYNTLKSYKTEWNFDGDFEPKIIVVSKTMHKFLKPPYGDCSDYLDHLFDSTNQWQCYRKCIKTLAQKKFNCKPVFIENTLHELDSDYYLDCNSIIQKRFDEYFTANNLCKKCEQICPKNCLNIDFQMNVKSDNNGEDSKSLFWDTTQPMFIYKEVPILSLIEYMVYLGGLVGLWFGTSAKDVVIILLDTTFWLNLWHNFLIKYNTNRNSLFIRVNH